MQPPPNAAQNVLSGAAKAAPQRTDAVLTVVRDNSHRAAGQMIIQ